MFMTEAYKHKKGSLVFGLDAVEKVILKFKRSGYTSWGNVELGDLWIYLRFQLLRCIYKNKLLKYTSVSSFCWIKKLIHLHTYITYTYKIALT